MNWDLRNEVLVEALCLQVLKELRAEEANEDLLRACYNHLVLDKIRSKMKKDASLKADVKRMIQQKDLLQYSQIKVSYVLNLAQVFDHADFFKKEQVKSLISEKKVIAAVFYLANNYHLTGEELSSLFNWVIANWTYFEKEECTYENPFSRNYEKVGEKLLERSLAFPPSKSWLYLLSAKAIFGVTGQKHCQSLLLQLLEKTETLNALPFLTELKHFLQAKSEPENR